MFWDEEVVREKEVVAKPAKGFSDPTTSLSSRRHNFRHTIATRYQGATETV